MAKPSVTAVITAMTDDERPFILDTLSSMIGDPYLGQILICVEVNNNWIAEVIDQFDDDRMQTLYLPMMVVSAARNRAVELAKYEWVAFCDGDDIWCPGKTSAQLEVAYRKKADFVGSDHYLADENGEIKACALACYIPMPSSWLLKTSTLLEHPFDEKIGQGQDGEWWLRTHSAVKKVRCANKLIKYRVRPNSLSSSRSSKKRKALIVQLASFPMLSKLVYAASYLLWFIARKDEYVWHTKSWGTNPALVNSTA